MRSEPLRDPPDRDPDGQPGRGREVPVDGSGPQHLVAGGRHLTGEGAGHGGKSGRWEKLHEVAETYGFILTMVK